MQIRTIDYSGNMSYKDCTKTETIYDAKGGSTTKTVYTDGTGTMKFKDETVTWEDKQEIVA